MKFTALSLKLFCATVLVAPNVGAQQGRPATASAAAHRLRSHEKQLTGEGGVIPIYRRTKKDSPSSSSDSSSSKPKSPPKTSVPTEAPTGAPTKVPSAMPSGLPTDMPSFTPSKEPSAIPTGTPTDEPSVMPSEEPSIPPTASPSDEPSVAPSDIPSEVPSVAPSDVPSGVPSSMPTAPPTGAPTSTPTNDCVVGTVLESGLDVGHAVATKGRFFVVGYPGRGTTGQVRVFEKVGHAITPFATIAAPASVIDGAEFGFDVDVTDIREVPKRQYIVVGAPGMGSIYLFRENVAGDAFELAEKYDSPSGALTGDRFGQAVAIDKNTDMLIVGAPAWNNSQGKAFVYTKAGVEWPDVAATDLSIFEKIVSGGTFNELFGATMAVDAGTYAIGAFQASATAFRGGAVFIYNAPDQQFGNELQRVAGEPNENDQFGIDISLSRGILVVGAHRDLLDQRGAAHIFVRHASSDAFEPRQVLQALDTSIGDRFGQSVAISSNRNRIIVGSPLDDNFEGANTGSVYVYDRSDSGPYVLRNKIVPCQGDDGLNFGETVDIYDHDAIMGGMDPTEVGTVVITAVTSNIIAP